MKQRLHEDTALQLAFKRARGGFYAAGIFSFFLNLLMLATPLYMLQVFERVLSSGHLPTLVFLTMITIFALLILGVLMALRSWILAQISGWLSGALSDAVIKASLERSLAVRPVGSQPLRDLAEVRRFVGGNGITALLDAPWVPVFILVIWLMHPWLGMMALTATVVLFTLALLNEVLTRDALGSASRMQNKAYGFAEASLRNAEAVQAMGMLPSILRRWSSHNNELLDQQAVVNARSAAIQGLSRFLRLSAQVGILALGATLILQSDFTPGQMIAGSILLGRALAPVDQSIAAWRSFVGARSAYGRLQELMLEQPARAPGVTLPPPRGQLTLENVTFKPPEAEKFILRGISFTLAPGESLGVVGPSAAGKSSLCRLLVGVWEPTIGSVRLDSADVTCWNREQFGAHVGYLPQDVELFSGTVRENIARLGEASDEEVIEAAKLAGAHEMILHLPNSYETLIGEGGASLSAGQRQRIGLARALFRNPRFIVLDEPNSNLDRLGEAALMRAVAALRQRQTTMVMVAHHASLLQNVDKLAVLREGRLEAFGPRSNVLAHLNGQAPDRSAAPPDSVSKPLANLAHRGKRPREK